MRLTFPLSPRIVIAAYETTNFKMLSLTHLQHHSLIQLLTKFSGFSSFHSYRQYSVSDLDHFNVHNHKSFPSTMWNFIRFQCPLKPMHSYWTNLTKNIAFFHLGISSKFLCSSLFPNTSRRLAIFSLN